MTRIALATQRYRESACQKERLHACVRATRTRLESFEVRPFTVGKHAGCMHCPNPIVYCAFASLPTVQWAMLAFSL